ncbi:hypothetical protein Bca52824_043451 [Brassica carinata]|uniref:Tr-type G domain-containing protein n=1 Tax=Brassica carinata TaxID=52824 RepID=A0A8X7RZA5_BRACI|nr:hypothetical protein Bca52824_043451 [Brassica carinata]
MAGPLLRSLWSNTTRRRSFSSQSHLKFVHSLSSSLDPNRLRNVAVIAHVDHGKTTLMDRLLRQCGADIPHERAMDSINLERERGITISSKVTSVFWKENELNMVDTPGHADFGGEVERVVGMVEGAILVVDAGEGPLAQTKFVLAKALKYGLRPILLLNKVDRPSVSEERCDDEVESLVFDLFANLGATEEQLDFPVLYASAKEGWASSTFTKEPPADARNMSQLLDAVVKHVPPPKADLDAPFLMLVSMMEKDFYLGRILTGRVSSGVVRAGDKVTGLRNTDSGSVKIEEGKVVKLMKKKGTTIVSIDAAGAGDIICMAGLTTPSIGHTVASTEVTTALPSVELDPPTISMTFGVNDSPLAGRDGTQLTGGELQLGILIENMRREGFELSVSPPKVMYKTEDKQRLEPIEEVTIEINEEHVGLVMEALSHRRAEVIDMCPVPGNDGRTRLSLTCPSRGLVGYRCVFSSDTRGTGFMHRAFLSMQLLYSQYEKYRGPLGNVRKGVLSYDGMIIGEHSRDTDLDVNPVKAKELTNIRSVNKDENVKLSPPRLMTLEEAIGYVASDELIEVTPKTIRLRKKCLDVTKRKSQSKRAKE